MNIRSIASLAPLAFAAALTVGFISSITTEAAAGSSQTCHMRGVWNGNTADVFEFDAAYVYNRGEDDFTGIYTNPGISQANISASARGGVWNILLSYIDAPHRGWSKKLVGRGVQDQGSHGILLTGTFNEYMPGSSKVNASGTFTIEGKCK
jgi:hypothetical protein